MRTQRLVFLVVAFFLFLPAAAWAQSGITGVVRDTSGAVLPGVTVEAASPVLIEGAKVVVSDGQGVYTIVDLRPGPYAVTFTLTGFRTFKREGIVLPAQFTATVNAEMAVGALEESITVSGEAPVVDIRSTRAQMQFADDTMEALPGAGRVTIMSNILPGATLRTESDRSVGGLNDRPQTAFRIHGGPLGQPVIDGVNVEVSGLVSGTMVYNQVAMQEVVLETSGVGADRDTGGIQINMVGKDGGNMFSGTGTLGFSRPGLETGNWDENLEKRGVPKEAAKSLKNYRDTAAAFGGPIKRDRLWFFGAFREGVAQQYATGRYYNKLKQPTITIANPFPVTPGPGESYLFEADTSRPAHTNEFSRDFSLRLTSQVAEKHKLVLSSSFQPNCNCIYNLLQSTTPVSPEATGEHRYDPNFLGSAAWTFPASNRLLLEAGLTVNSTNQNDTSIGIQNGRNNPYEVSQMAIRIEDQGLNLIYGSVPSRNLPRRQYQERAAVSYVTGSHNFKTGFGMRTTVIGTQADDIYQSGTGVQYRLNSSHQANRITLVDSPWYYRETVRDIALYAQDQWTIKKLTLNGGLRYNDAKTSTPEQTLPRGFWVPERKFAATDNVPHWKNLSPRIGAAYDLFGNGKTAIKTSLGHYPDRVNASAQNPANLLTRSTSLSWTDTDKDWVPDCVLSNKAGQSTGDVCGAWQSQSFGTARANTVYTDEAREGFNKQAYNWQTSVSVQHELRPGLGLNVGYYRTWYGGFLLTDNPQLDSTSYDPFCVTAPTDSRLPSTVSGQSVCGFYDLKPAFFGVTGGDVKQVTSVTAADGKKAKRTQVFNGVDITANARLARGVQIQGGAAIGRTSLNNCSAVDSPEARPGFCNETPAWSAGTQVKFLVVYPLPYDIQSSVIYQNVPGIPIAADFVASSANIKAAVNPATGKALGRDLTAGSTQTVTVQLIPNNSQFDRRLNQVDLRFGRTFNLGATRKLKGSLDFLNLFNVNNVTRMQTRISATNNQWQNAFQVLTGRLLKVGLQFDF